MWNCRSSCTESVRSRKPYSGCPAHFIFPHIGILLSAVTCLLFACSCVSSENPERQSVQCWALVSTFQASVSEFVSKNVLVVFMTIVLQCNFT